MEDKIVRSIEKAEKKANLFLGLLFLGISILSIALLISAGIDGVKWFTPGGNNSVGFLGLSMPGYMMLLLFSIVAAITAALSVNFLWKGL